MASHLIYWYQHSAVPQYIIMGEIEISYTHSMLRHLVLSDNTQTVSDFFSDRTIPKLHCWLQFKNIMTNLPEFVDEAEVKTMFAHADKDKNGFISYREFTLMCKVPEHEPIPLGMTVH